MTGSLVSPALRQRVRGAATPIATALGRAGLSPNALTVIGFLGTCAAAAAASQQAWLAAGVLALAFGIFDLFDGTLARATNQVTTFGAFLDSTLDRAGEAVVYLGIVAGFLAARSDAGALLGAAALGASQLVPYVRAKAESLGYLPGSGMMNVGLAPREIRLAILVVGLLGAGILPAPHPILCITAPCPQPIDVGRLMLQGALGVITILAIITAIQRILVVRAQAKEG